MSARAGQSALFDCIPHNSKVDLEIIEMTRNHIGFLRLAFHLPLLQRLHLKAPTFFDNHIKKCMCNLMQVISSRNTSRFSMTILTVDFGMQRRKESFYSEMALLNC